MAQGTLIPSPKFTGLDANGNPLSGGKLTSYLAGTSTLADTYTDVALSVANTNPVILDSSGRATVYLTPGVSYKFVLTTSADAAVYTQDNVLATPTSGLVVDQLETAGEALTAGQCAYLSDGSGGKTAGQLYKADSANTYSSLTPTVGFVPSAISALASGTFRTGGQVAGLSALTQGATYYVGTAGAITTTAPANARVVGSADSTSSLLANADPPALSTLLSPSIKTSIDSGSALLNHLCQGRLTLTSGTAVTTADVTAAVTIYFTPYAGRNISLYDGSANWTVLPFVETSLAVGTLTSALPYDVFGYNNSGTLALEALAWTNTTTRATALVLQDGVYSKTGALTRRYLGTFVTSSTTTTEDSFAKRYLWNYYNRVPRPMRVLEATDTWSYNTATYRQANAAATNQLDLVVGVAEVLLHAEVRAQVKDSGAAAGSVSIGQDSTTTGVANVIGMQGAGVSNGNGAPVSAAVDLYPAVGRHTYVWLEAGPGGATTTTWYGDNGTPTLLQSGIFGTIQG